MMGKPQREEHKVALLIACAVRKQRYQELAPLYSCKPHSQRYSSSIHAPPLKVPQPSNTLWLQGLSEHRCSGDLPSSNHSRGNLTVGVTVRSGGKAHHTLSQANSSLHSRRVKVLSHMTVLGAQWPYSDCSALQIGWLWSIHYPEYMLVPSQC